MEWELSSKWFLCMKMNRAVGLPQLLPPQHALQQKSDDWLGLCFYADVCRSVGLLKVLPPQHAL